MPDATSREVTTQTTSPNSNEQRAQMARANKRRNKPKEKTPREQEWRKTERSAYISDTSTNVKQTERGRLAGKDGESDPKKDEVVFSKELHAQYTTFLTKHVTNLMKVMESTDPRVRVALDNDPSFALHKQLLTLLTNETITPKGLNDQSDVVTRIVAKDKIEAFLSKDDGMIIVTQLLEKQIRLEMFALGIEASLMPPGEKQMTDNLGGFYGEFGRGVATGVDEGSLRHWWGTRAFPWLSYRITQAGGRPQGFNLTRGGVVGLDLAAIGAGAGIGALFGGIGAPIGAAVGGGLAGAVNALTLATRAGVRIELHNCTQAFASLTNADRELLRVAYQIDLRDYHVVNDRIERNPVAVIPQTVHSAEDRRESMISKLRTRQLFYEEIKVKPELVDAIPEQMLYRMEQARAGLLEQTGTDWSIEINREFQREVNSPPINGYNPANVQANLEAYERARTTIIERRMNAFVGKYAEEFKSKAVTDKRGDSIYAAVNRELTSRKAANGTPEGDLVKIRRTEIEAQKATLTADRARFTEAQTTITAYQEAQRNLTIARQEAATALATINPAPADINAAITELRRILRTPADAPLQINGVVYSSIFDERNNVATNLQIALNAVPGANPRIGNEPLDSWNDRLNQARQNERDRFRPQQEIVDERARIFNDLITQLQGIQTRIQTAETALAPNGEAARNYDTTVQRQRTQFEEITTWAPGGGVLQIVQAELLNLDVDAIILRINAINGQNNAMGWSEAQNGRLENRQRIVDAMNEARVRNLSPPSANLNFIFRHDISEAQIRNLNNNDLFNLISQYRVAQGWPPWNGGVYNAVAIDPILDPERALVNGRVNFRGRALEENLRINNEQITQQDDATRNINTGYTNEVNNLSRASEVMGRMGDVMTRLYDFTPDNVVGANGQFWRSITNPANANFLLTLTQSERNAQYIPIGGVATAVPRGYLEIMDTLFGYRTREATGRNAYFQQLYQFMPPNMLADYLNRHFNLGIAPANLDINNAIVQFSTRLGWNVAQARVGWNGQITPYELRRGFRNIINEVGQRQLAALP